MSNSVIPALVVAGSALAALWLAIGQPQQARQPSTNRRAKDGAADGRMALVPPALAVVREPRGRGRVASGFGLVALVMFLGMLVALGIGAAVVAATMALRGTAT